MMTDDPYNRAVHCKTEQLNQIIKLLNTHSVEYYTYVNMRVLMNEHRQEISILVKLWDTIPDRVQTQIRLLAYAVIDCEIDDDELKDTVIAASIDQDPDSVERL